MIDSGSFNVLKVQLVVMEIGASVTLEVVQLTVVELVKMEVVGVLVVIEV